MHPSPLTPAAAELATAVQNVRLIRMSELASSIIILYEHGVTLDQEINLVWRSPWSTGKWLFLINRYYSLLSTIFNNYVLFSGHLTPSLCSFWVRWQGWTGLFACMLAQTILQLRLYALYHLNKRVLAIMITGFIVSSVTSALALGLQLPKLSTSPLTLPVPAAAPAFCAISGVPRNLYLFWIPLLVFESMLCALALARGVQNFARGSRAMFRTGQHFVDLIVQDSVLYFLVMFATYFANAMIWVLGSPSIVEIPVGFSVAMSCVMGNRLCLNVRQMVRAPDEEAGGNAEDDGGCFSSRSGDIRASVLVRSSQRSSARPVPVDLEMAALRALRAG